MTTSTTRFASTSTRRAARRLIEAERTERKDRDLAEPERIVRQAAADHWQAQRDALMPRLDTLARHFTESPSEAGGDFDRLWQAVQDNTDGEPLANAIDEQAAAGMQAGGASAARDVGMRAAFDVSSPRAQEFLADRGAEAVTRIDEETRRQMRGVIERGVRDGRSYGRIADEIAQRFAGFSDASVLGHIRTRAELVATTEIGGAYEHAQGMLGDDLQAAGVTMEKRWIDVGDARVHPGCAMNADAGYIAHNEAFPTGRMRPPDHPGCRCSSGQRAAQGQPSLDALPSGSAFVPA